MPDYGKRLDTFKAWNEQVRRKPELRRLLAEFAHTVTVYGGRVRPQWPFLALSIGLGVLAIINATEPPDEQAALPYWAWGLIALACLNAAQYFVWRGLWIEPVEARHEHRLRAIAGSLRESNWTGNPPMFRDTDGGDPIVERIFRAHFPHVVRELESAYQAGLQARDSRRELEKLVEPEIVIARFPQADGWHPGAIFNRAQNSLDEIRQGNEPALALLEVTATITWSNTVVWEQSVEGRPRAETELRRWLQEVAESLEAATLTQDILHMNRARGVANRALEPLLHEAPIRKTRRCEICWPE